MEKRKAVNGNSFRDLNLENFDRQPTHNYMCHWYCTIFLLCIA